MRYHVLTRPWPVARRYLFTLDLPEYWENKHADQTLEVLMSDLDPANMDQFFMKDGVSASEVTRVSISRQEVVLVTVDGGSTTVVMFFAAAFRGVEFVT